MTVEYMLQNNKQQSVTMLRFSAEIVSCGQSWSLAVAGKNGHTIFV